MRDSFLGQTPTKIQPVCRTWVTNKLNHQASLPRTGIDRQPAWRCKQQERRDLRLLQSMASTCWSEGIGSKYYPGSFVDSFSSHLPWRSCLSQSHKSWPSYFRSTFRERRRSKCFQASGLDGILSTHGYKQGRKWSTERWIEQCFPWMKAFGHSRTKVLLRHFRRIAWRPPLSICAEFQWQGQPQHQRRVQRHKSNCYGTFSRRCHDPQG